jgi:hypothetical protein
MNRVIDSGVALSSNFVRPCSDGSETSRLNELYVSYTSCNRISSCKDLNLSFDPSPFDQLLSASS